MAKLHELLAAEANVSAAFNTVNDETLKVFAKPEHFVKTTSVLTYFDEAKRHLDVSETKDRVTSVDDRLRYSFGRTFEAYVNLLVQKDKTNQEARADLIVNGSVLIASLPATALLTLASKLGDLRAMLLAIPTLQPGPVWVHDSGENMWRTEKPQETFRSEKTLVPVVLYQHTDKHPAQVKEINHDIAVAKIEKTVWSAMWTSQQKHDILARLDALLIAIKKARMRANQADIVRSDAGDVISDFLLKGPDAESLTGSDTEAS